jgi:hypothetical protein
MTKIVFYKLQPGFDKVGFYGLFSRELNYSRAAVQKIVDLLMAEETIEVEVASLELAKQILRQAEQLGAVGYIFITRRELKEHFRSPKQLPSNAIFYPAKSLTLPKPLHKLRSHYCTGLLDVGGNYRLAVVWKDGKVRTQSQIYAHLFYHLASDHLYPLARMDYHPAHKGLHIKLNCEDQKDLSNRDLPGTKEFNLLDLDDPLDPRQEEDRQRFIAIACKRLGISYSQPEGL